MNTKCKISLLVLMAFVVTPLAVRADFDQPLKAALATVKGQRDTTMGLASDGRNRARSMENRSFPGQPTPPELPDCRAIASGEFEDMARTYNSVLDSIRDGSATEESIRSRTRTSVSINNSFIARARRCLSRNGLVDFSETTIGDAWIRIFNSFQAMSTNDKKKLSKELDKKIRWKSTRPSGF